MGGFFFPHHLLRFLSLGPTVFFSISFAWLYFFLCVHVCVCTSLYVCVFSFFFVAFFFLVMTHRTYVGWLFFILFFIAFSKRKWRCMYVATLAGERKILDFTRVLEAVEAAWCSSVGRRGCCMVPGFAGLDLLRVSHCSDW